MKRSGKLRAATALTAAVLCVGLSTPEPVRADAHLQGFGVASAGTATVTPGWSETGQRHEARLDFHAAGAAYAGLVMSPNMAWDCQHDPEEDDGSGIMPQGFTLTTAEADETRGRGTGSAVGRCTGWAPEYEFPFEITCPEGLVYARSDMILQLAGICYFNWGPGLGSGDLTLTMRLGNPSADGTTLDIVNAGFRLRA